MVLRNINQKQTIELYWVVLRAKRFWYSECTYKLFNYRSFPSIYCITYIACGYLNRIKYNSCFEGQRERLTRNINRFRCENTWLYSLLFIDKTNEKPSENSEVAKNREPKTLLTDGKPRSPGDKRDGGGGGGWNGALAVAKRKEEVVAVTSQSDCPSWII